MVVFEGDPGSEQGVNPPKLSGGEEATYRVNGTLRNLVSPLLISQNTTYQAAMVDVSVARATLPSASGEMVDGLALKLVGPQGELLWATASGPKAPFLSGVPERFDQSTVGEPLAKLVWRASLGPFDAFLLNGIDRSSPASSIDSLQPWATSAWPRDLRSLVNTTVEVAPSSGDEDTLRVEIQVSVEDPHPEDAGSVTKTDGAINIRPSIGQDTTALYILDSTCPFPRSVEYKEGNETTFRAQRVDCTEGSDESDNSTDQRAWGPFNLVSSTRDFPGRGDGYPLSYRDAAAFFYRLPKVTAFHEQHPDAKMSCAYLGRNSLSSSSTSEWSWFFRIQAGNDSASKWVTKLQTPTAGPTNGTWIEEPTTRNHTCLGEDRISSISRIEAVPIGVFLQPFNHTLPEEGWSSDAEWSGVEVSPTGTRFSLSRCARQNDTGTCGEVVPGLELRLDGTVDQIMAEPDWLPASLSGFLQASDEG